MIGPWLILGEIAWVIPCVMYILGFIHSLIFMHWACFLAVLYFSFVNYLSLQIHVPCLKTNKIVVVLKITSHTQDTEWNKANSVYTIHQISIKIFEFFMFPLLFCCCFVGLDFTISHPNFKLWVHLVYKYNYTQITQSIHNLNVNIMTIYYVYINMYVYFRR